MRPIRLSRAGVAAVLSRAGTRAIRRIAYRPGTKMRRAPPQRRTPRRQVTTQVDWRKH
jgi:hypothetical protein